MMRAFQRILRKGYMHAEALFNRAFGDKLNPLYHLGATIFYLFWIVGATGLYLYAFFDTSVTGAYLSVERLTHDQRWAGGIMKTAFDGVPIHIPGEYMHAFDDHTLSCASARRIDWNR